MRTRTILVLLAALAVLALATLPVRAQGYLEKKDDDAIAVIERILASTPTDPRLFDGQAVPAGADLGAVRALADRFATQLLAADGAARDLSPAGRQRAAAILARHQQWDAYGRALIEAYRRAQAAADEAARRDAAVAARERALGRAACEAFREEALADPSSREQLELVTRIAAGSGEFWQTVEDGARHLATMKLTAAACARPERGDIGRACAFATSGRRVPEGEWCRAVRDPDAVMKQSARSLAAWHASHLLVGRSAEELERYEGWLEVEGGVTWKAYFAGEQAREVLASRLGPVFAQAGLAGVDDAEVFRKLDAHYRDLEARVRALAPTWDLPGAPCKGVACAAARKGVGDWTSGTLRRLTQTATGWRVEHDRRGVPTYRWKSGFALIQVKGDPMCQLRSWTVSESHRGSGRYQAATSATLGYVRWQPCP